MGSTKDTGVDFVHRIMAEVRVMQEDLVRIQRTQAQLQTEIKAEQTTREGDVGSLHSRISQEGRGWQSAAVKVMQDDLAQLQTAQQQLKSEIKAEQANRETELGALHARISQERAAEALLRQTAEKRQDDFESKTRTWVGALGKDCVSTKEQLADFEKSTMERFARLSKETEARFIVIEAAVPKKGERTEVEKLGEDVLALQKQLEQDRMAAAAAVRTAATTASTDLKMVQTAVDQLQQTTEAGRKALACDLGSLSSRLATLDTFAQTRSKAADLQAVESRVSEIETSIEKVAYEVKSKAAAGTVNGISDRLTNLTMEVQAHHSRTQTERDSLECAVDKVEKALAKTDRQVESDRERTSACLVALEKEINGKATKADMDLLTPKVSLATERVEARSLELERMLHVQKQEVGPIRARVEALETAFPTRADAAEIPKLQLGLAEQAAKHDSLHSRTSDHSMRLEKMSSEITHHLSKLESVESRSVQLERQVSLKAEAMNHFTKDHTTDMLRDFYRREEIDAMLSRVWWRVGDMTKGRTVSGVPVSSR